jgi:arylsulfatase A-like enzyme
MRRRITRAAALGACLLVCAACGERRPGAVVLVVLDTLRSDRLSCYGNPRRTSPEIDALAARGVLFERVVTSATWTLPSFVSILTGRQPTKQDFDRTLGHSLVERLQEAGWKTAAFTEGGYVSREFRLDRGFDDWWEEYGIAPRADGAQGIERTFGAVEGWLHEHATERFFVLVHTYEVHIPYRRRGYAKDFDHGTLGESFEVADAQRVRDGSLAFGPKEREYVEALYDGGVANADAYVGRLLRLLEEIGRAGDTLVVVTSDHGEDLGEREPARPGSHGHTLYQDELRVPLILYDPTAGFGSLRIPTQVRSIDVLPTVLDRVGVAPPPDLDGHSLVPVMRGEETAHRTAYSTIPRSYFVRKAALVEYPHKLIENFPPREPGERPLELYDLEADPAEQVDRAALDPERVHRMQAALEAQRDARDQQGGRSNFDRPTQGDGLTERLRALGYVQ